MAWTDWKRPQLVTLLGDGLTSPWNDFDTFNGDELSGGAVTDLSEVYWFCNDDSRFFSSTAYAQDFGFDDQGIGVNDRIDGIEVETIVESSNGSRPNGLRSLTITKAGLLEQSENKADRVLSGAEVTKVWGADDDPWGVSGLTKAVVEAATWGVFWRTESATTAGNRARMKSMRMRLNVIPDGLLTQMTFTGLIAGSEVRVYSGDVGDPASATPVAGVESSGTSFSFTQPGAGTTGYVNIMSLTHEFITIPLTFTSENQSIPIQQIADPQYGNPA